MDRTGHQPPRTPSGHPNLLSEPIPSSHMDAFETIVAPVDGSDAARSALETAIAEGQAHEATVHVLAVLEPAGSPMGFGVEDAAALSGAVEDLAAAAVEADSPAVETAVRRSDDVAETIMTYAGEVGADLVVAGRQGTTSLPEAVLGSTADTLARESPVPVLLVPHED